MVHIFGILNSRSHLNGKIMLALLKPRFLATISIHIFVCVEARDENDEGREFKIQI